MIMNRTKNASRNMVFGMLLKIYQVILPFVMRTLMVYTFGVQYLGLNSLFVSVLQVLNLAELGVGSAMVFSMYKPIVEEDYVKICALMRLYKIYYRVIGGVVLGLGLLLLPVIPSLISGEIPSEINIYILYLLNLLATVLTYWLFAYKNSILQAYQRTDYISKITLGTDTFKYLIQIVALIVFRNYYWYVIAILMSQVLNNVITAVIAGKLFPNYHPVGKLPEEEIKVINKKIKDLFTSKLGYTILSSADTLSISTFLGLTILAQYQNYQFIMTSIFGFIAIVYGSITAGVGNSMITESTEQNCKDFKTFTVLITWLCGVCVSCFAVLYQPFMELWMGKDLILDYGIVVLFCIYFWVYEIVMMISVYKDAGGIWHEDRFRPLISGIVNVCLNLCLVKLIGLYGILLATILSISFVSIPWIIKNVFKNIFNESGLKYACGLIAKTVVIAFTAAITYFSTAWINGTSWSGLIIKGGIAGIESLIIMGILLMPDRNFKDAWTMVLKILNIKKAIKRILG